MKLLGRPKLLAFERKHPDVRGPLRAWVAEVQDAEWQKTMDIKERYQHASFIDGQRVVFNLKGNSYRLDTRINFVARIVLVIRAGTHAEYTRWRF
jgi:mRNA interferase HigB